MRVRSCRGPQSRESAASTAPASRPLTWIVPPKGTTCSTPGWPLSESASAGRSGPVTYQVARLAASITSETVPFTSRLPYARHASRWHRSASSM